MTNNECPENMSNSILLLILEIYNAKQIEAWHIYDKLFSYCTDSDRMTLSYC